MPDRSAPEEELTGSKRRVLIVEDEPIIAFALEDIMEDFGQFTVTVASTVEQALASLDDQRPDVAILDVNLHGQKSYPLADELKERSIRYIFATGYGSTEHPADHRDITTVTKPYSPSDVRSALEKAGISVGG